MGTESYVVSVAEVVKETDEAVSVVFDVPEVLKAEFAYLPGQFLTLAVPSEQTGLVARSYSLSSSPHQDRWQVTVKRTVGGYASNWICNNVQAGSQLRVIPPSGIFSPKEWESDLLLFAGGSGITPVLSIARTALHEHNNRVVLVYANRDEQSVIFASVLRELQSQYPDRFVLIHWLESLQGLPSRDSLRAFAANFPDFNSMVCGPAPFMDAVTGVLKDMGWPRSRRLQERFVSLGGNPFGDVPEMAEFTAAREAAADSSLEDAASSEGAPVAFGPVTVEAHLDDTDYTFDDWDGQQPLLDFLTSKGVEAPYSCKAGQCSACACVVLEGDLAMNHNEVLEEDDLREGIRLACQATALSPRVKISYNA
ncbi:MAG: ferredoxin--NADP reductase [Marmoricola sp.]